MMEVILNCLHRSGGQTRAVLLHGLAALYRYRAWPFVSRLLAS
jgi:hypothetical protein